MSYIWVKILIFKLYGFNLNLSIFFSGNNWIYFELLRYY